MIIHKASKLAKAWCNRALAQNSMAFIGYSSGSLFKGIASFSCLAVSGVTSECFRMNRLKW